MTMFNLNIVTTAATSTALKVPDMSDVNLRTVAILVKVGVDEEMNMATVPNKVTIAVVISKVRTVTVNIKAIMVNVEKVPNIQTAEVVANSKSEDIEVATKKNAFYVSLTNQTTLTHVLLRRRYLLTARKHTTLFLSLIHI